MWTFTAYIVHRLCVQAKSKTIRFSDLVRFVFDILWKKYGVVLNSSTEELEREVEYLRGIGAVDYDGNTITAKEKLGEIVRAVEKSCLRDMTTLYNVYLTKINEALEYHADKLRGNIRIKLEEAEITLKEDFHVLLARFKCPVCGHVIDGVNVNKGVTMFSCPKCATIFNVIRVEAYLVVHKAGDPP